MSVALESVRADTPGVDHVVHLDNAGSALVTRTVLDTVVSHLELEARRGGYQAAREAAERTEAVYESVARLVGGDASEVALTESATSAWQAAVTPTPSGPVTGC
ncbi:MAG: aminotransferase class V-fold PLP-dependent enzyme [Microthrixaceae bacterium]